MATIAITKNVTRHDATKNIWNGTNFVSCLPSDYKGIEIPCYFIHNGLRLPGNSPFVIDANFDEIYQGEAYFEVTKVYPSALQIAEEIGTVSEAIRFANSYLSSLKRDEIIAEQIFVFNGDSYKMNFYYKNNFVFVNIFSPEVGKFDLGQFNPMMGCICSKFVREHLIVKVTDNSTYNDDGGIVRNSSIRTFVRYNEFEVTNLATREVVLKSFPA